MTWCRFGFQIARFSVLESSTVIAETFIFNPARLLSKGTNPDSHRNAKSVHVIRPPSFLPFCFTCPWFSCHRGRKQPSYFQARPSWGRGPSNKRHPVGFLSTIYKTNQYVFDTFEQSPHSIGLCSICARFFLTDHLNFHIFNLL